ncbi:MAG: hypothetical protein LUE64_06740 [Candidatus Gastranaerophilales bacterium]|nr:hypothetical protein [Candidatus Gastranaerophilales bacterium]
MSLEDNNTEKNNMDFSLEEGSDSISWEDLLNTDNDIDMSNLLKDDTGNKEHEKITPEKQKEQASSLDYSNDDDTDVIDLDALTDFADSSKKAAEAVNMNDDDDENVLDLDDVENWNKKEENQNAAPVESVKPEELEPDIQKEAEIINITNEKLEAKEETIPVDNSFSNGISVSDDISTPKSPPPLYSDEISVSDDDLLTAAENYTDSFDFTSDLPPEKDDAGIKGDFTGIVDDELLSILNEDKKTDYSKQADEIFGFSEDKNKTTESSPENKPLQDEPAPQEENESLFEQYDGENAQTTENAAVNPNKDVNREDIKQETIPAPKRKKPVALIAAVLLVGILAVVFYILTTMFAPSTDKEVSLAPEPFSKTQNRDLDIQIPDSPDTDITEAPKKVEKAAPKPDTLSQKDIEEPRTEKKKIIIAVNFQGRQNPFVPSVTVEEGVDSSIAKITSDLSAPPDINPDLPATTAARKLLDILVSGIMYDSIKPSAVVKYNDVDYFVQTNDRIDDYTVKQITRDYVIIANGTNTYRAYVGEAFRQEDLIPESNKMKIQNGQRQYISSDIEINTK